MCASSEGDLTPYQLLAFLTPVTVAGDVTTACVCMRLTTAFTTMPDTRLKLGIHDKRPGDTVLVPSLALAGMTGELTAACMIEDSKLGIRDMRPHNSKHHAQFDIGIHDRRSDSSIHDMKLKSGTHDERLDDSMLHYRGLTLAFMTGELKLVKGIHG